jgi:hypothetical protein
MLVPIVDGVLALGKTWLEGKNTKIKAKAEAEATVLVKSAESEANWENIMAQNSASSWKDEWITILFSIPMILCFFPATVEHVRAGFVALDGMPTWYQYTLSIIVAASFGVRSAIGFMKK